MKTSFLAFALMVVLASMTTANAAPKQPWPQDAYNQTFGEPMGDQLLFNRAKGNIDD